MYDRVCTTDEESHSGTSDYSVGLYTGRIIFMISQHLVMCTLTLPVFLGGGQVTSDFIKEVLMNSKNLVMLFQNVLTFPTPNVGNFPEMMSYFTKLINDDVITQQVSNHWKAGCFCLVCVVVSC